MLIQMIGVMVLFFILDGSGNRFVKESNDFNSNDLIFEELIYNIIDEETEENG